MYRLRYIVRLVFTLGIILTLCSTSATEALDGPQHRVMTNGILHFNIKDCATGESNVEDSVKGGSDPNENAKIAFHFFVSKGFKHHEAAGIIGNFMQESGMDPTIQQDGSNDPAPKNGVGFGLAQWTFTARQKPLMDFAAKTNRPVGNLQLQLDFVIEELLTTHASTIPAVRGTSTPEEAAYQFQLKYEGAGVPAQAKRDQFALDAMQYAADAPPIGSAGDITQGAAATPGGGGTAPADDESCEAGSTSTTGGNFPLTTTKTEMDQLNPGLFKDNTTGKGGHPYTAYDILANPGTPVIAFKNGSVTMVTEDRCPGRMVSVFNTEENMTISYLHMDMSVNPAIGTTFTAGQEIGKVGPPAAGCGIPHLHIDAAKGNERPGCSRLNCPASNASQFIDIGPGLFEAYQKLPQ